MFKKNSKFIVEFENDLGNGDFLSLRLLYTPLLGINAPYLYEFLFECSKVNKSNGIYLDIDFLRTSLNVSLLEIEKSLRKLGALGLIRIFRRNDEKAFIFSLKKPLDIENFKKNSCLYPLLLSKIDQISFEKIEFLLKSMTYEKEDFTEVTAKFQDIFALNHLKKSINNSKSSLEFALPDEVNKDNAIKMLSPEQYVFFLTKTKPKPSLVALINKFRKLHLGSVSINCILDYSFKVNSKFVNNHIEKIAKDFIKNEIYNFESIKEELNNAWIARNTNENNIAVNGQVNGQNYEESDMDWDELFKELGGY